MNDFYKYILYIYIYIYIYIYKTHYRKHQKYLVISSTRLTISRVGWDSEV